MRKTLLLVCAAVLVLPSLAAAAPAGAQEESVLLAGIFAAGLGVPEPIALADPAAYSICGECEYYSDCTSWCSPGYFGVCNYFRLCGTPEGMPSETACLCIPN